MHIFITAVLLVCLLLLLLLPVIVYPAPDVTQKALIAKSLRIVQNSDTLRIEFAFDWIEYTSQILHFSSH